MSESQDPPFGQRLKRGFETKILIPAATAIVGAAASYLIKKLPLILEEKVLPKLLEKDAPQPVVKALEQTAATLGDGSDAEEEPAEKAEPSSEAPSAGAEQTMSNDEREEERRKREQRRRQRKSASAKAA